MLATEKWAETIARQRRHLAMYGWAPPVDDQIVFDLAADCERMAECLKTLANQCELGAHYLAVLDPCEVCKDIRRALGEE